MGQENRMMLKKEGREMKRRNREVKRNRAEK
jgi:hypothetical protein